MIKKSKRCVIKHRWPNDENINENQFGMSMKNAKEHKQNQFFFSKGLTM